MRCAQSVSPLLLCLISPLGNPHICSSRQYYEKTVSLGETEPCCAEELHSSLKLRSTLTDRTHFKLVFHFPCSVSDVTHGQMKPNLPSWQLARNLSLVTKMGLRDSLYIQLNLTLLGTKFLTKIWRPNSEGISLANKIVFYIFFRSHIPFFSNLVLLYESTFIFGLSFKLCLSDLHELFYLRANVVLYVKTVLEHVILWRLIFPRSSKRYDYTFFETKEF